MVVRSLPLYNGREVKKQPNDRFAHTVQAVHISREDLRSLSTCPKYSQNHAYRWLRSISALSSTAPLLAGGGGGGRRRGRTDGSGDHCDSIITCPPEAVKARVWGIPVEVRLEIRLPVFTICHQDILFCCPLESVGSIQRPSPMPPIDSRGFTKENIQVFRTHIWL